MYKMNTVKYHHEPIGCDLFFSLFKAGLRIVTSLVLLFILLACSLCVIFFYGSSFVGAFIIALLSAYTLGRNWIHYNREWRLHSLWPACIPLYFFLFLLQSKSVQMATSLLGDYWASVIDWVVMAFFLYLFQKQYHNPIALKPSLSIQIFNRIIYIAIHFFYGVAFQIYCPETMQKIEWGPIPFLKPDFLNLSKNTIVNKANVILYCADRFQEEKIIAILPTVLETIQSSPFYHCERPLKICQKNNLDETNSYQKNFQDGISLKGLFLPFKNYSYVFLPYENDSTLIHALRHELAHQVLALHYGTLPFLTGAIPVWKDEGYAEYLSRLDQPFDPLAWLSRLKQDKDFPLLIADPFSREKSKSDYREEDYDAAFLQTFYALRVLSLDPNIFFQKNHSLASCEAIENWLHEAHLHLQKRS